jgi:DNA processing protein
MNEQNLKELLALRNVKGLGGKRTTELLDEFSSISRIFEANYEEFSSLGFVSEGLYKRIQKASHSISEYQDMVTECREYDIDFISALDSDFPNRLKKEKVAALLFTKGDQGLLGKTCISIVGSRESSKESIDWAFNVAKDLSQRGYVIVSGGARGVDTAAHKGALAGSGETICVLGSGISNVYPPENEELVGDIAKTGLVISHRSPSQNVNRYSLLDRNEITSGLSPCLLIASSSGEGGTASQYEDALAQNKQILCPNPSMGLEPNDGIVKMTEEGEANTVYNVEDIVDSFESRHRQATLDEL